MPLNNVTATPPEGMADWVRQAEAIINSLTVQVAALQTQLNARR